jgi:hypothetical protein
MHFRYYFWACLCLVAVAWGLLWLPVLARGWEQKLQLTFRTKKIDALGGAIEARRADGTMVKIRLTPVGERDTAIGVRVGTWGNREKSEIVHSAIRKEL